MWLKTVDDEYVNTDNLVDIRAHYSKEHDYTLMIGTAVTGQQYFLKECDGEKAAIMNAHINKLCKKLNKEE